MYIPKKVSWDSFNHKQGNSVIVVARSEHFPGNLHIRLEIKKYPCGRIKLVARYAGSQVTGDIMNTFKHITFDSVKSVYNVPGLLVLTPPEIVYNACCKRPYGIK